MNRIAGVVTISMAVIFLGSATLSAKEESSLPSAVQGFSGQVHGKVVEKGGKNSVYIKVDKVLRVWKDNNAEKPEALVGRTVKVNPRWVKGDNGRWHPVEGHVRFIRSLSPGQEITLEIGNFELSHFNILELSQEQRRVESREREHPERKMVRDGDDENRELREEVRRLEEEVAELRQLLKDEKEQ